MMKTHCTVSQRFNKAALALFLTSLFTNSANSSTVFYQPAPAGERAAPNHYLAEITPDWLVHNLVGVDLSMNILIKYLLNYLDAPLQQQSGSVLSNSNELELNAKALINGYPVFGLLTGLTQVEKDQVLEDAYSVVVLLDMHSDSLSIDLTTQADLDFTIKSIIVELENAE